MAPMAHEHSTHLGCYPFCFKDLPEIKSCNEKVTLVPYIATTEVLVNSQIIDKLLPSFESKESQATQWTYLLCFEKFVSEYIFTIQNQEKLDRRFSE